MINKKHFLFSALALILFSSTVFLGSGCGSSGGSSNPYSGNYNAFVVGGTPEREASIGTCQITQNGSSGTASYVTPDFITAPSYLVTFNGANMVIRFGTPDDYIEFNGTWTSTSLFNGNVTYSGDTNIYPLRLRRI